MVGSGEHSNETFNFIKGEQFFLTNLEAYILNVHEILGFMNINM
jgi:hypothetical protein